jgi:hypothetical protein
MTDRHERVLAAVAFFLLLLIVGFVVFGNWFESVNQRPRSLKLPRKRRPAVDASSSPA